MFLGEGYGNSPGVESRVSIYFTCNGEAVTWSEAHLTLSQWVKHLRLNPNHVVIEKNLQLFKPEVFAVEPILEGDRVEVLHFVGGGMVEL